MFASSLLWGEVRVVGQKGQWGLEVNGKPFALKGVGLGRAIGRDGTNFIELAKNMHANTVRTWGIDQGTQEYLDLAHKNGLYVNAGIWVNWVDAKSGITYLTPNKQTDKIRSDALAYVKKFKNHPAILMWNVGNEALFFTESPEEKLALAKFLNQLMLDIKKEDPTRPVTYAAAGNRHFGLIKKHIPALDILGANIYGTVGTIHSVWEKEGFSIPYMITEFGHRLPMDRPKDKNKMPIEPKDQDKAMLYRGLAREIKKLNGHNLGGFVFHLGDTTQESLTWWNLTHGPFKKQPYLDMTKFYSGKPYPKKAPRIKAISVSKVNQIKPREKLDVSVALFDKNTKGLKYEFALSSAKYGVLLHYPNEPVKITIVNQSANKATIRAPKEPGLYRLYAFVRDSSQNIATINTTIVVEK